MVTRRLLLGRVVETAHRFRVCQTRYYLIPYSNELLWCPKELQKENPLKTGKSLSDKN